MLLIVIYSLSTVLVFLNIEPLKIAAIFLGICYLPGLSLLTYGRRGILAFEDLVLAFPCSVGVSSIATVALLLMGIHVQYIFYVISLFTGVLILLCAKRTSYIKISISSKERAFFFFAFLGTLLLSLPILLGADRIAISSHGFFHSTLVTQIINGIFPPENPGLGGVSISYQWGFHAFVAAISSQINLHPLQVISALNVISLFIIFSIAYRFSKAFGFSEGYCYLVPLAMIGLMRLDAGFFFINKWISGSLMDFTHSALVEMKPADVLQNWVWGGGAPWYDRRLFFLSKFYNANTIPLGISLCISYFMLMLKLLEEGLSLIDKRVYLILLSIVIAGCFIIYPPIAIIILVHAPLWIFFIFIVEKGEGRERLNRSLEILMPYVAAIVCVIPYLLFITKGSNVQGKLISLDFYDQSIKNIIVFWLSIPVVTLGVWVAVKRLAFSRKLYFLLSGTLLCLGLSVFMKLPMLNSAKFTFVLSFFFALFFTFAVSWLLTLFSNRWLKRFVATIIIIFLLITPAITVAAYMVSSWFKDVTYAFSGRHIIFAQDKLRNEAYEWIRENSPPDALIMLTYVETTDPDDIGQNTAYEPAAITERNLYAIKDSFTSSDHEFARRVSMRKVIFEDPDNPQIIDFLKSLKRPVYLLIEKNLHSIYLKDEIFDQFPENPGDGFLPKFRNESQRVYLLQS